MLPALRKIKDAVGKTAWMPQMLCSGLCERVASGTVSISLRYSVGRLCARVEIRFHCPNSAEIVTAP